MAAIIAFRRGSLRFIALKESVMRLRLSVAALTCAVIASVNSIAAADIAALLPRVPAEAHALVAINVRSVLDSPVGKAQGCGTKQGARPLFLPQHAASVVFAANFNFAQAETDWEVGLVETDAEVSM